MTLLLIHHAQAASPYEDPQRPLTEAGHEHARRLAELVKARGFVPSMIWHSGKLRGRQTGHAFLEVCAPFASFTMVKVGTSVVVALHVSGNVHRSGKGRVRRRQLGHGQLQMVFQRCEHGGCP